RMRLKQPLPFRCATFSATHLELLEMLFAYWRETEVAEELEDAAQCLLVIIGATPEGKKELVGLIDGVRESAQSWRELLLDLRRRGLAIAPELALADSAIGFWQAVEEVWPKILSACILYVLLTADDPRRTQDCTGVVQ